MSVRTKIWRGLKWLGVGVLTLVVLAVIAGVVMNEPRPDGHPGPEAEAMTQAIEGAVDLDAWDRTGAVRFTFAGRDEHLWDRERGLSRVAWGDIVVLQRLDARIGRAFESGHAVEGARRAELVEDAWARWCNDSFWLNPLAKLHDDGVTRSIVALEGGSKGLLVSYASGGVTPGDAYLWTVDGASMPDAWQMWVSVIPVGGVRATWDGWTTLATGAKVSTRHQIGPMTLEVTDVAGATTLSELEPGADPFAALLSE